jgi:UDP-N-acetylmuramyl pentapeptide phosphotransferase/UDP-N-acetylglucosamine-1-phosphate transferase
LFRFGLFNVKGKTFAGDVGSISMAVFFGLFYDKDHFETGQLGFILFFSVYGIDAIITIVVRLKQKKIFSNRIGRIYTNMANEMGYSHVLVSFIMQEFSC